MLLVEENGHLARRGILRQTFHGEQTTAADKGGSRPGEPAPAGLPAVGFDRLGEQFVHLVS
ncbi:hypothetical protein ACFV2N_43480 [Streptomyces sp. NPDC059680]|uniref:hypothetical protein n=1 Tax=Streptomyces sp. NPDC059680 TaxID=3346904 RepID=UPI0036A3E123